MQVVVDRLESTTDLHVYLSPLMMNRLRLDEGDVIKIASPARKFIIVAVSSKGFRSSDNCILIGNSHRQLLECYLGESVLIEPFKHCQAAKKVIFAPISDTMNNITGNFRDIILNSNYNFHNIPVWKDMVIPFYTMQHVFEFRVVECAPISAVIVANPEVIQCHDQPVERTKSPNFDKLGYDDIGGVDEQIRVIRKLVEVPRTSSAIIVAPSGCGKTYISSILRNETKSHFEFIPTLELLGLTYEKSRELLGKVLTVTNENTPAIVYIDDIDALAAHQNYIGDQKDDRLVNALADFIERLRKMTNVLVIATSKTINDLRNDFKPPNRFSEVIKINMPTRDERANILRAMTRKMMLTSPGAIDDMASMTEGQTASDLLLICQKTILSHLSYLLSLFDLSNPNVPLDDLKEIAVGQGVYSASHNRRIKKNIKEPKKKKTAVKLNKLDPFGDLVNDEDSDESDNQDVFDNDQGDKFSIIAAKKQPSQNQKQKSFGTGTIRKTPLLQSNDDIFDFGHSSHQQNNNVDIFSAPQQQTLQSADPFAIDALNGSSVGIPSNERSHKRRHHNNNEDGNDSQKHHKHHKHRKHHGKDDKDMSGQGNPFQQSPDPLTATNMKAPTRNDTFAQQSNQFNNYSSYIGSTDLFGTPNPIDPFGAPNPIDPFGAPNPIDPFGADKEPVTDPNAPNPKDPFETSSSNQKNPLASPSSVSDSLTASSKPANPFAAAQSKPSTNAPDPWASSKKTADLLAAKPRQPKDPFGGKSDPFASNQGSSDPNNKPEDPFAKSSPRHMRGARDSIDPFALPRKK
ncbi:hypothetical protein TRFO_35526 [Tritrichomonas foetus]|uniref:ATPase AAA-type core domain-containing protein n=1 Tax=Tritrichomonas foetus TaxID=1144522 RepID=A0A1J4JLG1_9EUKA|nr:hypothetical protein TRFO_35526 [Tritrichomonas foetus]|eukprot:OHS98108.1 hypothetical protein TRFO_35526 [Tritrichomonas foetus]